MIYYPKTALLPHPQCRIGVVREISALFGLLPGTGLASFVSCRLGPVRPQNHARDQHSESPQHGLAAGRRTRMRWFEGFEAWRRTKFETKLDTNEQSDKYWASREWAHGFRCLLEQGQHALLRLVGLGQHGGGGLRDDLRLGQAGRLFGVVGVHDAAA